MSKKARLLASLLFMFAFLVISAVSVNATTTRRALVIGESDYQYNNDLDACANDADAVARVLKKTGYTKVTTKHNLPSYSLEAAINNAFSGADSDDVSLFYYSGHGSSSGAIWMTNESGVSSATLAGYLKKIPGKVIVISDACYSGMMINKSEGEEDFNQSFIDGFKQEDVITKAGEFCTTKFYVVTASTKSQTSLCNSYCSYFTYYMIAGAGYDYDDGTKYSSAPADTNGDKKISISEIKNYANKNESRQTSVCYPATSTYTVYNRAVSTIRLNSSTLSMKVGGSYTLKLNGTTKTPTWKSSNTAIATVSSTGVVKAKSSGTVKITATLSGKTYTCTVTVAAVKLNKTTLSLSVGSSYTLKLTGTVKTPTWKSSNTALATVSSTGVVKAVKTGTVKITATVGTKVYTCTVTVTPRAYAQTGKVKNAKDNSAISGAAIYVYKGYNNHSGSYYKKVTTDSYGKYKVSLPKGQYTFAIKKTGYVTSYQNYSVTKADTTYNRVFALTKTLASTQYRIVLTWGANPTDLDSHIFGPSDNSGNRWHTYFGHREEYNYSKGKTLAKLDVDDRDGYGPETITLDVANKYITNGTYRYYVYDYDNRYSNPSTKLAYSGAKVTVYKGSQQVATYTVPRKPGTVWHVFDIVNGQIVAKNSMAYKNAYENYSYQ